VGLLDDIGSRQAGGLGDLLGNAQGGAILSRVTALINDPRVGGLSGLVQTFHARGLGGIVASWVGTGANQPITPEQVTHALGEDRVQEIAQSTGAPASAVAGQLASLLPALIDKLTPNGTVPDSSTLANALSMAQSALGGATSAETPPAP
jgi:uncharacterized protein YidB (DUF937 family)